MTVVKSSALTPICCWQQEIWELYPQEPKIQEKITVSPGYNKKILHAIFMTFQQMRILVKENNFKTSLIPPKIKKKKKKPSQLQ